MSFSKVHYCPLMVSEGYRSENVVRVKIGVNEIRVVVQ